MLKRTWPTDTTSSNILVVHFVSLHRWSVMKAKAGSKRRKKLLTPYERIRDAPLNRSHNSIRSRLWLSKSRHLRALRQLTPRADIGHELCGCKWLLLCIYWSINLTTRLHSCAAGVLGAGIFFRGSPHLGNQVLYPSNNVVSSMWEKKMSFTQDHIMMNLSRGCR